VTLRRLVTISTCSVLIAAGLLATPAAAATITVNDADEVAIATDGFCTLREAITSANSNTVSGGVAGECAAGTGASDTIDFNIAGTGPHTIALGSALPAITAPVTIDGYCATCDGATPATATSPAVITIVIDGNPSVSGEGLELQSGAGGSTIAGLSIIDFNGDPIELDNSDNNVVRGNHIATGSTGVTSHTCHDAVNIQTGSTGNLIGGSTPADRNVIGGCTGGSVLITGTGTNQNVVSGNYIGVGADGTSLLSSATDTIFIGGSADQNTIGGDTVGERNVIGGGSSGVEVDGAGTDGNAVLGNYIGTTATGADGGTLDNAFGVRLVNGPTATQVSDNLIAFNNVDGVRIEGAATAENPITRNSIHSNTGLGINLGTDGVTENDVDDIDASPNNLQNFPVIDDVLAASTHTRFQGSLNSEPNTSYLVHFYANAACDPSGNGEGQRFLSSTQVTTNAGGDVSFDVLLPGTASATELITGTATKLGGGGATLDTSEFSDCQTVEIAPGRDARVRAKPKRVEQGERTKLTGSLSQCTTSAVIEFQRKRKGEFRTFKTKPAADCDASTRLKIKKKTAFRIVGPPDGGFDVATSKPVKVRLKPE
jgi:hypothetical protein